MIYYFSGCGNSRYVAEELGRLTHDTVVNLTEVDNPAVPSVVGIVCPVYSWAVPHLVDDFVRQLASQPAPDYCYLACTCGDNVGRTVERFARLLRRQGWHLHAAFSFVMPETYVNVKGFNLDTPEGAQRKIDAVRERLPQVAQHILQRDPVVDVVKGGAPWLKTTLANPLFYGLLITDKKFVVHDTCISCGLCEQVCPLHNITLHDGRPSWHGHCTNCMACYHHCPKNAIHFGTATEGKGQYFFNRNNNNN